MEYKLISIDETGKASFNHASEFFILSGVVLPEKFKVVLDRKIRRMKMKYFQNEEIIFHTRDMLRKKGQFIALQDPKVEVAFWSEFISFINHPKISLFYIIVNKAKVKNLGWQPKTVLRKAYLELLEGFASQLKVSNSKGRIIVESDPAQDTFLIQAHNRLQALGTTDKSINNHDYQQMVTSLSLVNKENLDIDIQIADALAPFAGMKYKTEVLKEKTKLTPLDKMKVRLINRKLANKTNPSLFKPLI
ncbi:MAG: DUF3800 domain-containing protein [Candidatus Levybacteria bacterium]|nr:DUF3800 domain-containing protein [Candidatus Levybacteria bacterium]